MDPPRSRFEHTADLVEDFAFLMLQDPEQPDLAPGPFRRSGGEIGVAGIGMVALFCLGPLSEPRVHVEMWAADPGAADAGRPRFDGEFEARPASQDILIPLDAPGPSTSAPRRAVIPLRVTRS